MIFIYSKSITLTLLLVLVDAIVMSCTVYAIFSRLTIKLFVPRICNLDIMNLIDMWLIE